MPFDFNDLFGKFSGNENSDNILRKAKEFSQEDEKALATAWLREKYPGLFPVWPKSN